MNNLAQCTQLVNDENISKCEQLSPRKSVKQDNSGYFRNLENYCNFLKSIGFKVYNDGKSKFITTYNKKSQKRLNYYFNAKPDTVPLGLIIPFLLSLGVFISLFSITNVALDPPSKLAAL